MSQFIFGLLAGVVVGLVMEWVIDWAGIFPKKAAGAKHKPTVEAMPVSSAAPEAASDPSQATLPVSTSTSDSAGK